MSRRRANWGGILEGEVVTFRYKGKKPGSVNRLRTCLILNTRHLYAKADGQKVRLVHALQFDALPRPSGYRVVGPSKAKKIFSTLGDLAMLTKGDASDFTEATLKTVAGKALVYNIEEAFRYGTIGGKAFRVDISRGNAKADYRRLKRELQNFSIYRTFTWERLKANSVFRETDYQWPTSMTKKYLKDYLSEVTKETAREAAQKMGEQVKRDIDKRMSEFRQKVSRDLLNKGNVTKDDI